MENLKEKRKKIALLIEDYMRKKIDYNTFYENTFNNELIDHDDIASQAIHLIGHYESDQDIMSRDPEYKKYMDKEVMDSLQKLRGE